MDEKEFEFKTIIPHYEFSSFEKIKGSERANYMHVMAKGCKLINLQGLVEQHLEVTQKEDSYEQYGRTINYSGHMQGVSYKISLEWGSCPTMDGAEGHNVEIKSPLDKEDKLSPIVAEEMKKYEVEMTQHIQKRDSVLR